MLGAAAEVAVKIVVVTVAVSVVTVVMLLIRQAVVTLPRRLLGLGGHLEGAAERIHLVDEYVARLSLRGGVAGHAGSGRVVLVTV